MAVVVIFLSPVGGARADSDGTAIVRTGGTEYLIPIVCKDSAQANAGFSTEASRITKAATGRSSLVRLNVRPWKETSELVISLDRYVAWAEAPPPMGAKFTITLAMSPATSLRDGLPVTLTYEMWTSGDRPEGLNDVYIEADCSTRDPEAPTSRRIEQ